MNKKCPSCGITKSRDEFYRHKNRRDGLQVWCKACDRKREIQYRSRRKELNQKPENQKRIRQYNLLHSAEVSRRYRESSHGREMRRKYQQGDAGREAVRKYSASAKGRESRQVRHERRRAREVSAINTLTIAEWREIVASYLGNCVYCGAYCQNPSQDHIVPLSKGGEHTADNVVPACGKCNSSKGSKSLLHWMAQKSFQYI